MVLVPAQRLAPLAAATGVSAGGFVMLIMLTIGLLIGLLLVVALLISLRRSGRTDAQSSRNRTSSQPADRADGWTEAGRRTRPLDPPPEDKRPS